jgi:hypothetical protein
MGTTNGKAAVCPFNRLKKARIRVLMTTRFNPGAASDFYHLCKDGKIDEIRQILDNETSPPIEELNRLQPNGSTALHVATYYDHLEIVKLLFEHNCPQNILNLYGNIAYDEAKSIKMKQLFMRPNSTDRFHEINTAETISMFFPKGNIESINVSQKVNYVHLFRTESEIIEYPLKQQTIAMWLNFYNWFFRIFRTFTEPNDFHIDTFDLINHPNFQEFLQESFSDPVKYTKTMKLVNEAKRRNSIEPLITLYTSENAGFYRPFNQLLRQSSSNTELNEHLCDRFIIEFYIRHQELRQRAFTGIVYRGATIATDDLPIYYHALDIQPPGVLGFKSFTSASKDPLIALKYLLRTPSNENEKYVLFIFEIMEVSSTIFGVDDISEYPHEQEVIILPGNLFIVVNIEEHVQPPIIKIYLRHVNIPISFFQKIKQTRRSTTRSVS